MEALFRYVAPPSACGYLPDRDWSLEYELVLSLTAAEYMDRLRQGWRRFGTMLFRPQCPACQQCQSLRVLADRFQANRSQRRVRRANEGVVELKIGAPAATRAKLDLYDRFHAFQTLSKGWPEHPAKDAASYRDSFVNNPFATEEWCYYLDGRLVGVGYLDVLPGGLSAIYFFYEPSLRQLSLGTWNVLNVIEQAAQRKLPHVYLGYFVPDCTSLAYKARFGPNQIHGTDGQWRDFKE